MTREIIALDDVVKFLNELLEIDKPAIAALLANRVPCNQALADHPTVQVHSQHGGYSVGMFGIINGLFGTDEKGCGQLRYVFDDGQLIRFERFTEETTQHGVVSNH
jgi:hypothetical protein